MINFGFISYFWLTHTRRIVPGVLRITRYHGYDRTKHFAQLLDFDIVLTTYGTVATEFRKSYKRGREVLYYLRWFRIVLDEGQYTLVLLSGSA